MYIGYGSFEANKLCTRYMYVNSRHKSIYSCTIKHGTVRNTCCYGECAVSSKFITSVKTELNWESRTNLYVLNIYES